MKATNKLLLIRAARLALGQGDPLTPEEQTKLAVVLKWMDAGVREDWQAIRDASKETKIKDEAAMVAGV